MAATTAGASAEVLDSTHPSVEKGSYLWGYLPIGTLAQDLVVEEGNVPGQVIVTTEHRQAIMPIYNRYIVHPPGLASEIEAKSDRVANDALIRVIFETAYLMNRFVFTSDPKETVKPRMDHGPWSPAQADSSDRHLSCPGFQGGPELCAGAETEEE